MISEFQDIEVRKHELHSKFCLMFVILFIILFNTLQKMFENLLLL